MCLKKCQPCAALGIGEKDPWWPSRSSKKYPFSNILQYCNSVWALPEKSNEDVNTNINIMASSKQSLQKKRKGISNRYIPKAKRCMLHSILFAGFVSPDFDQQKKDTVALLSYLLSNALCGNDDLQWAGTWITLMGLRAAPQYKTIQEPVDVPCTQLVGEQQSYQSIFFVLQHLINVGTLLYNGQGRGQTLQVMKT